MSGSIQHTYQYAYNSHVDEIADGQKINLATTLNESSDDLFFDGKIQFADVLGKSLLVLSDIVRTRFYQKFDASLLDPVITSGSGVIRLEGFSSCCGVYARVDLFPDMFQTDLRGKGTTNVDFNTPLRVALKKMTSRNNFQMKIGGDQFVISEGEKTFVEKKVKLPVRWIKGFCEVQSYQPLLTLYYELTASEVTKLFRSIPKSAKANSLFYLTKTGPAFRLGSIKTKGAVKIQGANRIKILEGLIPITEKLRIWFNEEDEVSGWEFFLKSGKFFALISPEPYRGFSGEGQALSKLAITDWKDAIPDVAAALNWQSAIDTYQLSQDLNYCEEQIISALAVLGTRGLTGFDVSTEKYFHRVLPFEMEKVEKTQPRLKNARELVKHVKIIRQHFSEYDCLVPGTDYEHFVRLDDLKDRCTCQWYTQYLGKRGPCKHILAARILIQGEAETNQ